MASTDDGIQSPTRAASSGSPVRKPCQLHHEGFTVHTVKSPPTVTEARRVPPGDPERDSTAAAAATTEGEKAEDGKKRKPVAFHLTFTALNICVFLVSVDATALPVAIPVIAHELSGTTLEAFWAGLCFLLAVVAATPVVTGASDVLGRSAPLYASFAVFAVGSVVFATAGDMRTVIVGRVLQGLGGGGLDVLSEVVLADVTALDERPKYLAIFSVPMAAGAVCGPVVAASLAEFATWRWIGWINLPFGGVGLLLLVFSLRLGPVEGGFFANVGKLDWGGMALFLAGLVLFSLPISWAGALYPWTSYRTLVPFFAGVVFLVLFGWYEARPVHPIFPHRIFRNRTAVMTLFGSFVHGAVAYSSLLYLTLTFQATFQDTPFRSAVEALPSCAFIVVFSVVAAVSVEVLRRYRWIMIAAWPCLTAGIGLLALLKPDSTSGLKYGPQALLGTGIGVLFVVGTFPMNASQRVDDAGLATGIMVSFRMFGGVIGLGLGSSIFSNVFTHRIAKIEQLPGELSILRNTREAIAFVPSLRKLDRTLPVYNAVIESYRVAFMSVFLTLAGTGVLAFLSSFFVKELSIDTSDVGRQGLEEDSQTQL